MKSHYKPVILLLTMILTTSCKELFYPDNLESTEQIPVIQGMICEGCSPTIELTWAMGYYDNTADYISGATIYITDNLDNTITFEEYSPGKYAVTDYSYHGIAGREYTLHVITSEGFEYVSSAVRIHEKPVIDSLYAKPDRRTVYSYNTNKEPVTENQEGLFILSDLSKRADSTLYFRFNTSVIKESTYIRGPTSMTPTLIYKWDSYELDDLFSVENTIDRNDIQVILEHEAGYLEYLYDPSLDTEEATAPVTAGWILTFRVYAISADVYDYYDSMRKQLNSDNQMFAPLPSQIKSNIHCLSNPDRMVTGVFEAASSDTLYKAFHYNDLESYNSWELPYFPEGIKTGSSEFIPDFWLTF